MRTLFSLIIMILLLSLKVHSSSIRIASYVYLPKDSIEKEKLINSLNEFLDLAQKSDDDNKLIYPDEKLETSLLLRYFKDIEKSNLYKNDNFYTPYLTNIVNLNYSTYLIQLSYCGLHSDSILIKANFRLLAHKTKDIFEFSSLFKTNTESWRNEIVNNIIFKYKKSINKNKTSEFGKIASIYDKKLKCEHITTEYFCCQDIFELQFLLGIDYLSSENGAKYSVCSASSENRKIVVLGNNKSNFDSFDPHDLWHDRMSLVLPRYKANKPVDEGCAYLYGGSWGISWEAIFHEFKLQIANKSNIDWREIKETPIYFKTKEFSNSADYIVNALIVKKIESEKGFEGVWELLNVGPFEKGNDKYYKTLEKLTGITKEYYNDLIWDLIKIEK